MQFKGLTPILDVSDIRQSFAWFEKLGWETGWSWEGVTKVDVGSPEPASPRGSGL